MLDKVITSLTPNYKKLDTKRVFLMLFAIALFIRFPFFFRDYIDLDESTFILMGQSWIDGHLPFTHLWDLKPPLTFLFFAGIIGVFGKSFFAIRLSGTLVVALGGLFLFKTGDLIGGKKVGLWSGIFFIILSSSFGSLQGVMSEHLSVCFFLGGFYLLIAKQKLPFISLGGILLGCALMTKLNLSYSTLLFAACFAYYAYKSKGIKYFLFSSVVLGLSILLPAILLFLFYFFEGHGGVWWQSVIEASLAYGEVSFMERIDTLIPILLFAVATAAFIIWNKRYRVISNERYLLFLLAIILGILFSFYKVGKVNGHYLIQLYPFLLLLLFSFLFRLSLLGLKWVKRGLLLIFMLIPMEAYLEYFAIAKNFKEKNTLYNGEGIEVPNYLIESGADLDHIWFLEFHIGYWVLDQYPITKATTHPSNLMRDQLFAYMNNPRQSSLDELKFILKEKAPTIIVTKEARIPFNADNKEEVYAYFEAYLSQHYSLIQTVGKATIYKRLN